MDFGKVFSESWRVFRRLRVLWVLGLLTGCSGIPLFPNYEAIHEGGFALSPFLDTVFLHDLRGFEDSPGFFLSLFIQMMLYVLVISLVIFVLQTLGKTAIIKAVQHEHEHDEKLKLRGVIEASLPALPKVFLLSILIGVIYMAVFIGVYMFGYLASVFTFGLGFLCLFPFILVLGIFSSVYYEMALRALLLEDMGVFGAMGRAWQLIRRQPMPSGIFAIVFYFLQVLVTQIVTIPVFVFVLPFIFAMGPYAGTDSISLEMFNTVARISSIGFLLYYPVIWIVNGLVQSFTQTGWSKVYREYLAIEA